jgi:D-alanyl-D-alanine carboxypeptidase
MNTDLQMRLQEAVQRLLDPSNTPGASVAVRIDGRPVWQGAVGYRDLQRSTPLGVQDLFFIYSITKTLTAAVLLQMDEQERISLDAPVQVYLPEIPLDAPVTIRQLLNHTGGIPDYGSLRAYHMAVKAHPSQPWGEAEFLANTLTNGLVFPPGEGWRYSNIGFLLLRRVIESVLHSPFRAALHDHLFAPLHLEHIFVTETLEDTRGLAPGFSSYLSTDGSLQDVLPLYHPGWVSHGVAAASAPDLAQVMEAILAGPLLDAGSRTAMLKTVIVHTEHPLFQRPGYGLGVMIDQGSPYGLMVGHGGGGPGYSAGALHLPNAHGRRITSVALTNSDADDLGLEIAYRAAVLAAEAV